MTAVPVLSLISVQVSPPPAQPVYAAPGARVALVLPGDSDQQIARRLRQRVQVRAGERRRRVELVEPGKRPVPVVGTVGNAIAPPPSVLRLR